MNKVLASITKPACYQWEAPSNALEAWSNLETGMQASESPDPSVIDIIDVIGENYDGSGVTESKIAGLLRKAGKDTDITVNINTPGGDVFQGIAIYGRLRDHKGKVTVNVRGVAASAGSLIAMAGDTINMSTGSMMMIHNAWGLVIGNRHDMIDAHETFAKVDESMAEIYMKRSGMDKPTIVDMMDGATDGTFMTVAEALQNGFADKELDASDEKVIVRNKLPAEVIAKRKVEAALAKEGVSRKQRAAIMKNLSGERDTTGKVERDADNAELVKALTDALAIFKS